MNRRKMLSCCGALIVCAGCQTLHKDADPIAVRAEQTLSIALVTIDEALKFEFNRRDEVPETVRAIAHGIRKDAAMAFMSADRVRVAYKQGGADAATLLKAINVVDALVGEIKWWMPDQFSSSAVLGSEVDLLLNEAAIANSNTTGNWLAAVPMFIELGKTVYSLAMEVKQNLDKDREWSATQDAEFRKKLLATITQEHWKA